MKNHLPMPRATPWMEPDASYNERKLPPAGKYVSLCVERQLRSWDPKRIVDCRTCASVLKNGPIQFRNLVSALGVRSV